MKHNAFNKCGLLTFTGHGLKYKTSSQPSRIPNTDVSMKSDHCKENYI